MEATRHTLLARAGRGAADAWTELNGIYQPFIRNWFRAHGFDHDAEDLTQEVLMAMHRELPGFQHSQRHGAFRAWLRTACLHRMQNLRRAQARHERAVGGTDFSDRLHNVEAPEDGLAAEWDREHDRAVLRHLFERLRVEFDAKTLEAFQQLAVAGRPAADVAADLGMTPGAAYVAKSRVLRRLREEAADLIALD